MTCGHPLNLDSSNTRAICGVGKPRYEFKSQSAINSGQARHNGHVVH